MKFSLFFAFVFFLAAVLPVSAIGANPGKAAKAGTTTAAEEEIAAQYQATRIKKMPIAVQCWTFHQFSFFETLEKVEALGVKYLQAYPGQVLDKNNPAVVFGHEMNPEQIELVKQALKKHGISLVGYGVVGFENTAESIKKVFEFARTMGIRTIMAEPAGDDFSLLENMVKEYDIKVAIHNHPKPSKYALPETVLKHIEGLDERIGVCADTGHWMRSGVCPLSALRMLKGRILDVHLKDLNKFASKKAYDVPFGKGKANIHDILAELTIQDFRGFLVVEHENEKELKNPAPSITKGLEYIKSITYYQDYNEILSYSYWAGCYTKAGWNHYGPGYFILCEKTGVLKSQGGMGLFWYSVEKYKDFILELDYKTTQTDTNSGIFYRVPQLPTSDDYIYHCFEIQVYDKGQGIHKTAAVYDAEPPTADAFKPTGEWNHFKITVKGNNVKVELNGQQVVDWNMEPRGKIKDFADEGYIGLQNHDSISPVYFRNIFIKEL